MRTEIIAYIARLTNAVTGQLPENGGLVVQTAPSGAGTSYFDGSSSDTMSLLFLCKSKAQSEALGRLHTVCQTLTRQRKHGHGIYGITVATAPNYVARDGGFWIYSCIINLNFYNHFV